MYQVSWNSETVTFKVKWNDPAAAPIGVSCVDKL